MEYIPGREDTPPKVVVGSWVIVQEYYGNKSSTYRIVPADSADPVSGRISAGSPLGAALLGHCEGESVSFAVRADTRVYKILRVIPTVPPAYNLDDVSKE